MATFSLDYDGTYTRDKDLWNNFITLLKQKGHKVYVVTMRYDHPTEAYEVRQDLEGKVDGFFFTGRQAKKPFMKEQNIWVDIWIDDQPEFILGNAF